MPENTAQLRDARLTPDDFTPAKGPVTREGIDLRDPRVAQAFQLGAQAADLLDERARLLEAARYDAWLARQAAARRTQAEQAWQAHRKEAMQATTERPEATEEGTPMRQAPMPPVTSAPQMPQQAPQPQTQQSQTQPQQPQQPRQPRRSSIQLLLLILGIGLITAAVLVFATIAYTMLGDAGRAACIGAVGIVAVAAAWALTDRLRVTAEGLMWGGLAALVIDAHLIGRTGLIPTPQDVGWTMPTGALLIVLAAIALGVRMLPVASRRPLRAPTCFAVFALPLGAFELGRAFTFDGTDIAMALGLTAAAAVATSMAAFVPRMRERRAPDFEWLASLVVAMVTIAGATIATNPVFRGEPRYAVTLPCVTVCLAATAGLLLVMRRRNMLTMRRPAVATPMPMPGMPGTMGVPGVVLGEPQLMEAPLGQGWRVLPWIVVLFDVIPFSDAADSGLETLLGVASPWPRTIGDLLTVTAFATAALLAILIRRGWALAERVTLGTAGTVLLAIVAIADWQWKADYGDYRLACAFAALAALLAAMAAAWIRAALMPPMPRMGQTPAYPGVVPPRVPMPLAAGAAPANGMMPGAAITAPDPTALDDHKALDTLRWTVGVAAAFAMAIMAVLSMFSPQHPPFPAELPATLFGVTTLAIGGVWLARRPMLRSWPALSAGLALTLLPSLAMSWSDTGTIALVRATVLGLLAVAAIVWGAAQSLQAPLLGGTVVLVVHVLTQVWPLLVRFTMGFWWVWLAVGGVVLVIAAARYEHSLNSMKSMALRFSQLR